jgi:hypothetical protein
MLADHQLPYSNNNNNNSNNNQSIIYLSFINCDEKKIYNYKIKIKQYNATIEKENRKLK